MGHRCLALLALLGAAARADDLGETIVVTATRAPVSAADAPAPVAIVRDLAQSKAVDEALRDQPSFATFRRSSSLVADPSSQGVNLRGVGPSGVSRALVLEDGVPVNDGFGGWIYWGAIPRLSVERIEVAPGASSALYGSSALGGVVQLISRPIEDRAELELQGGSFGTALGAVSVARKGAVGAALDLEGLTTGGYTIVASPGAIDRDASSRHFAGRLRLEAGAFSLRAGAFAEDQGGGTQFTTASAREGDVAFGYSANGLDARLFTRWARFDQQRARIAPGRASEQLASTQSAPADEQGASVQWRRESLTLGADLRRVFGRSIENASGAERISSGEQRAGGIFAEEVLRFGALQLQAAVRADGWHNLGSGSDAELSPRLAARVKAAPWLALRAAGYRSFRAPTLNELYRPFQVGQVRTDANPNLGPETLLGAEAGVDLGDLVQATAFVSRLEHPIVNATIGPNHQMRENLGAARIAGIELRASRTVEPFRLHAAWTWAQSRVFGSDTELPQDPRHRLAGGVAVSGFVDADLEVRWTSDQFEDDLNQLRLPGFAVVDVSLERRFGDRWSVFAAAENLLDRRYLVGLQGGVATIGQPLCVRAGVRVHAF
ncbi:MAG: TonB-dependent receptor [Myxococcales bacterium]|nr:TonB-dependent receptor [Myxococcales bacterium]